MMNTARDAAPWRCHGCHASILDKYLSFVNNEMWHLNCVRCRDCGCTLEEKCYSKNGSLYCQRDYFRRFGPECRACRLKVFPEDVVIWVKDMVFHDSCIQCTVCSRRLETGDRIYCVNECDVICEEDYFASSLDSSKSTAKILESIEEKKTNKEKDVGLNPCKEVGSAEGSARVPDAAVKNNMAESDTSICDSGIYDGVDPDGSVSSEAGEELPGQRIDRDDVTITQTSSSKKRGPRTTIKAKQLDMLKAAFIATPKPTRHAREQLAKDTGLSMRVIQVWFQNRRSKERRMKQVGLFGSRRHLYGSLSHGRDGISGYASVAGCQAPNVNILDANTRIGLESLGNCGESSHTTSTPYHSNESHYHNKYTTLYNNNNKSYICEELAPTTLGEQSNHGYFVERQYSTDSVAFNNGHQKYFDSLELTECSPLIHKVQHATINEATTYHSFHS